MSIKIVLQNLREIRQTMGRVVDFLFRTHFPDFPLENVGDVHQFVSDVRELEYEAKIYKVFPTNSMTDEELAEAIVCEFRHWFRWWSSKLHKNVTEVSKGLIDNNEASIGSGDGLNQIFTSLALCVRESVSTGHMAL